MKITLQIEYADGTTKEVVVSAADMVAFESKYDISIARLDEARISWLLFLAWHSENRRKVTTLDYDAWLDTVESVGGAEDPKVSK
jgi:hypothetical protein